VTFFVLEIREEIGRVPNSDRGGVLDAVEDGQALVDVAVDVGEFS
jgi:hypothetical protein